VCCVNAHILPFALELMVKLDFLIYGPCHAPFISMATEGRGGGGEGGGGFLRSTMVSNGIAGCR